MTRAYGPRPFGAALGFAESVLSSLRIRFGRMVTRANSPRAEFCSDLGRVLPSLRFGRMVTRAASPRAEHRKGLGRFLWLALVAIPLTAAPVWKAPSEIAFGQLAVLELREDDPAKPALPRPAEEKLGPLALRSVDPLPDGRGWRLTVQALNAGTAVIPPMDLGDGRRSPELRLQVPRSVPFGAPWMGVGGGQGDILPYVPFPWAWASLLLLPPLLVTAWLFHRWRKNGARRALHHRRRAFAHHWPPADHQRETLDRAHAQGRDLLAARFGEEARSWGVAEFRMRQLEVWATWVQSLDAARFARKEPPFPPLPELLKKLEAK